jgi:hypothetical protein
MTRWGWGTELAGHHPGFLAKLFHVEQLAGLAKMFHVEQLAGFAKMFHVEQLPALPNQQVTKLFHVEQLPPSQNQQVTFCGTQGDG